MQIVNENENEKSHDDFEVWWDARLAAMESVLGPSEDMVAHSPIPLFMGGAADVVFFKQHVDGVVSVTCELIGAEDQPPNEQGAYDLAICTSEDDSEWAANLIAQLAAYTLETPLNPGDTMDIAPALPDGSTIAAFLYCDFGRLKVCEQDAGLLLCLGITADELAACQENGSEQVLEALKLAGVYPFTMLSRDSVI